MEREIQWGLTMSLSIQIEILAAKGGGGGTAKILEKPLHHVVSLKTLLILTLGNEKGKTPLKLGYGIEMTRKVDVTDGQVHLNTMEENGGILRTKHVLEIEVIHHDQFR
jgi:hypothetical protein